MNVPYYDDDYGHVEYGVRIDGDVVRFPGHTLARYELLATRNSGQVVYRHVTDWLDYAPNDELDS